MSFRPLERKTTRKHLKSFNVERVYPTGERFKGSVENLKSVGLRLTGEQAKYLGKALIWAGQGFDIVDLTAYRSPKNDGTHHCTLTFRKNGRN